LEAEETPIGLYALDKCDGASIFNAISDVLLRLNINLSRCRGATFDGASSFSSEKVGVGARLQEVERSIILTHCHMHCVNLAVQYVMKDVAIMRDFLQFAQHLITFLRDSPKRCATTRKIAEQLGSKQKSIRPLCPTRFTVKYLALSNLYVQLEVVIEALETMEQDSRDRDINATAAGFRKRLCDFDVYFCFVLACRVFECTDRRISALQGEKISVGHGVKLVEHTVKELSQLRTDDQFQLMWNEADARRIKLGAQEATLPRQARAPRRLQQSSPIVYETAEQFFRAKYFQVLDVAQERLKHRITNKAVTALLATERLLLHSWNGSNISQNDVSTICTHYSSDGFDGTRLTSQLLSLANMRDPGMESYNVVDIISAVGQNSMAKKLLPQVVQLMRLYVVCPATTATGERTFSALKRLKTVFRSTMGQKRLNALLLLSVYPKVLDELDLQQLIRDFVLKNDMRRSVFFYN